MVIELWGLRNVIDLAVEVAYRPGFSSSKCGPFNQSIILYGHSVVRWSLGLLPVYAWEFSSTWAWKRALWTTSNAGRKLSDLTRRLEVEIRLPAACHLGI